MPYFHAIEGHNRVTRTETDLPQQMVCGRAITQHPPYPNTSFYHGRLIVFCTRYCLEAYEADPERFYCAHSKTGDEGSR